MTPHTPTYTRSRFPKQPPRADGTRGCRGCGGDIPKGRQTWCSRACCKKFHPFWVKRAVIARDKGWCQLCKLPAQRPEYDHIVPFSEGGLTVLENMRTLCRECHRKVTAEWRRKKSQKLLDAQPQQEYLFPR